MEKTSVSELYYSWSGHKPSAILPIDAEGSSRHYYRLTDPRDAIACVGNDIKENRAFFYFDKLFRSKGLPVPELYKISGDETSYLQQDLGDVSLFSLIQSDNPSIGSLLSETMSILPEFQLAGLSGVDYGKCYPRKEFDLRSVLWDLNYFKYCFLKPSCVEFDEDRLENEFQSIASDLCVKSTDGIMLRDFQSRNVMIYNGNPFLIDFQGARKGPALYDVASFLWQARVAFSDDTKRDLSLKYYESWLSHGGSPFDDFEHTLHQYALLRTIQVLGAYGFRGLIQHKSKFVTALPKAIDNLIELSTELSSKWPYINECALKLKNKEIAEKPSSESKKLRVKVYSFSFKKGIPEDYTGNGGGFVFDCRGLNNPGRYDRYKPLTGLDDEVVEFLEKESDINVFMNSCYKLVDASVENYIKRGFNNLSVSFGCTGGRHRSVYGAQHMAEHLASKYPIVVKLHHREQNINQILTGL